MENLLPHQYEFIDSTVGGGHNFRNSAGGHMSYRRMLFEDSSSQPHFVKAHDISLFTEAWREKEMRGFLQKEGRLYNHLVNHTFTHIPQMHGCSEDALILSGLTREEGWHWRAPKEPRQLNKYIDDVLESLIYLEAVPLPDREPDDEVALDVFYNFGWDKLHETDMPQLIKENARKWQTHLLQETIDYANRIADAIGSLSVKRADIAPSVLNHHDARQANIAWNPKKGVRIVDWSWADVGLPKGDTTMFLLDLHKAGYDISKHSEHINPVYAKMVLGYWLQRSGTPHMEGNDTVRMHQFISAIKASELILGF